MLHGTDRPREMWNIGDTTSPVYQAELKFDKLRYALLPYIYSLAGMVTHEGYTMMRPLVMDFRGDARARSVTDEYMFGPAFLVSPVTEYKRRQRDVYLPDGEGYDFWTGKEVHGGTSIAADAPYDALPVFVRAGSIIPTGPEQQFTGEATGRELTVRVYPGRDARFTLYEDDGTTYGYETGEYSTIPITWTDATRTLQIGARSGTFPGMLTDRTFNVTVLDARTASGRAVLYNGKPVRVQVP